MYESNVVDMDIEYIKEVVKEKYAPRISGDYFIIIFDTFTDENTTIQGSGALDDKEHSNIEAEFEEKYGERFFIEIE